VIRGFKLAPRWKIVPPRNLEGEGFEINFKIRSIEDYKLALKKLESMFSNNGVEKLFNLL